MILEKFLCCPDRSRQKSDFSVWLLLVPTAPDEMSFEPFEHFVQVRRIWSIMPGMIAQLERLSRFLQKIGALLNFQQSHSIRKLEVLRHQLDEHDAGSRHCRSGSAYRHHCWMR